jgi:hypothetical protein
MFSSPRAHAAKLSQAEWVKHGADLGEIAEEFVGYQTCHREATLEWTEVLSKHAQKTLVARAEDVATGADTGPAQKQQVAAAAAQSSDDAPPATARSSKPRLTGLVPTAGEPDIEFLDEAPTVEDLEMRMRVQQKRQGTSVRALVLCS